MAMIKLIREILVQPFWVLLVICRFIPFIERYELIKLIWKIGRDPHIGCRLIPLIEEKEGLDAARLFARQLLEETNSSEAAQVIGVIEYKSYNCQKVREWIELAEKLGCKDQHFLLILKIFCSTYFPDYEEEGILEQMLECSYLPSWMSRFALLKKGHFFCEKKLWQEAEEIADYLLSIKEDPFARVFKWIVCLQKGNEEQAEKHFAMSKGETPESHYLLQIGEGYLYLDREDDAMEWLYKSVKAGMKWPVQKESPVGNMLKSRRFAEYCAMRN